MFNQLPFPVLSTAQVMAQHPKAILRKVDTYNRINPKAEITVAQVAEWVGNQWNGYWITDPIVVDELLGRRLIIQDAVPGTFKLTPEAREEMKQTYGIREEITVEPSAEPISEQGIVTGS